MNLLLNGLTLMQGTLVQDAAEQASDAHKPTAPVMVDGPDSYYSEALRNKIRANVPVELEIDKDGKVITCTAMGDFDEGLKQASCERMRKTARFEPARDAKGRAIPSRYNSNVRWGVHPNMRRHPLQMARGVDGSIKSVVTFIVETDGRISSCKGSVAHDVGWQNNPDICDDAPAKIDPYLDANGRAERRKVRVMIMLDNVAADGSDGE